MRLSRAIVLTAGAIACGLRHSDEVGDGSCSALNGISQSCMNGAWQITTALCPH